MNRRQRRAAQRIERRNDKRASVGRAWAEIIVNELAQIPIDPEQTIVIEAGVIEGFDACDLRPVAMPDDFLRSLILARPISADGAIIPFRRVGALDNGTGWAVVYDALCFIIRGNFVKSIAAFKEAVLGLDFPNVVKLAPPSPRYSALRSFHIEELQCPGYPIAFLNPFHPDERVDEVLRRAEDAVVEEFWRMTEPA